MTTADTRKEAIRLAYKTGYSEAYEDCTGTVDHNAAEEGWQQYAERTPLHEPQPDYAGRCKHGIRVGRWCRACEAEL